MTFNVVEAPSLVGTPSVVGTPVLPVFRLLQVKVVDVPAGKALRLKVFPIAVSLPWGIAPAALPQIPLPAKIRTMLMPAIHVDPDPARLDDEDYIEEIYQQVQASIQEGMDTLARRRAFPLFG